MDELQKEIDGMTFGQAIEAMKREAQRFRAPDGTERACGLNSKRQTPTAR